MLEFPKDISPINKAKFPYLRKKRNLAYLRRDIYEFLLIPSETYFDLEHFYKDKGYTDVISGDPSEITKTVISELESLGWKTKLIFRGTGLVIYDNEIPPIAYGSEI